MTFAHTTGTTSNSGVANLEHVTGITSASNTNVAIVFNKETWNWGDVEGGKVRQNWKIVFAAKTNATETLEWEFDVIYFNPCYDHAVTVSPGAVNIPFTLYTAPADGTSQIISDASTPTWTRTDTLSESPAFPQEKL